MSNVPFVVGIGGTTRAQSSVEKLVRCVLEQAENQGAATHLFDGRTLASLPHYSPENPERTLEQKALVEAVRKADAVVIGSPAYHGGISALVKNAIDLLEDLNKDTRVYLSKRPVGLVVSAYGWQACGLTLQSMRGIVHSMRGWPTPLGITVNALGQKPFNENGELVDEGIRKLCSVQAQEILDFVRAGRS